MGLFGPGVFGQGKYGVLRIEGINLITEIKKIYLHPILIPLLPILSLYENNVRLLSFREVWDTLLVVFVVSLVLWGLIRLIFKNSAVSALVAAIFWILFYGIIPAFSSLAILVTSSGLVDDSFIWVHKTQTDLAVLIAISILFLCTAILLSKTKRDLTIVNKYLNIVVILMLGWNIFSIVRTNLETRHLDVIEVDNERLPFIEQLIDQEHARIETTIVQNPSDYLDIYYIILDGYGRADTLQAIYNFDNSSFLDALNARGFYIAEQSNTNYNRTIHSLASSLNMMYLDPLSKQFGDTPSFTPPIEMLQRNLVFRFLEERNYLVTTFATGYSPTEIKGVNNYLSPKYFANSFQGLVIYATPLSFLLEGVPYDEHRKRIIFALEEIPKVNSDERPVFVFAHIINPHPPFVFDSEGNPIKPNRDFTILDGNEFMEFGTADEYIDGYKAQVEFISKETLALVDSIIENADKPPIIIIQGDHGPGSKYNFSDVKNTDLSERMPILNAYYFPDQDYSNLYKDVTPINSFRIVLNQYLGTNLAILDDRNYFVPHETPSQPIDVTELVR